MGEVLIQNVGGLKRHDTWIDIQEGENAWATNSGEG